MGHDITAYRPGVDADELYEKCDLNTHDNGWSERFARYEAETSIAYNRRSATSPLNQVLYLALGVMDEAYAGCSGNGAELAITLEQFENAQTVLEVKSFGDMKRDRNFVDTILDFFRKKGSEVVDCNSGDSDVSQEKEFVERCLTYLKETGETSIVVSFS